VVARVTCRHLLTLGCTSYFDKELNMHQIYSK